MIVETDRNSWAHFLLRGAIWESNYTTLHHENLFVLLLYEIGAVSLLKGNIYFLDTRCDITAWRSCLCSDYDINAHFSNLLIYKGIRNGVTWKGYFCFMTPNKLESARVLKRGYFILSPPPPPPPTLSLLQISSSLAAMCTIRSSSVVIKTGCS